MHITLTYVCAHLSDTVLLKMLHCQAYVSWASKNQAIKQILKQKVHNWKNNNMAIGSIFVLLYRSDPVPFRCAIRTLKAMSLLKQFSLLWPLVSPVITSICFGYRLHQSRLAQQFPDLPSAPPVAKCISHHWDICLWPQQDSLVVSHSWRMWYLCVLTESCVCAFASFVGC